MRAQAEQVRRLRGFMMVYALVIIVVLCALASLGVDFGRVQVVKTELQRAADAAARYAAAGLSDNTYLAKAQEAAAENMADGSSVVLAGDDIERGNWGSSGGAFTPGAPPFNAIRITTRRSAARGNAVPLLFAKTIGIESCDVSAVAIARAPDEASFGFVALDEMEFKNNAFIGSYRSSLTTNPTPGSVTGKGGVTSNGTIQFKNNGTIHGGVTLGPTGSIVGGVSISGSTIRRSSPMLAPPGPAWTPAANPNGVPQNYTVNSNTTLPGGTYWFTSLRINKRLTFSGPATLYVNGDIWTDDEIVTCDAQPANLQIYQLGADRTFTIEKALKLVADVHAPGSDLIANNKLYLLGSGTYRSLLCKNSAELFVNLDTASSGGQDTSVVALVR